jgi:hypothetical protein
MVLVAAMAAGMRTPRPSAGNGAPQKSEDQRQRIPSVGKISVLNGCGVDGAANIVSEFLRQRKFDVKNIGNAPTGNYQTTLVVSRRKDSAVARKVADALNTNSIFLMRNGDDLYDVTVYVGADFQERVR